MKRSNDDHLTLVADVVLMDIEGTTTSIEFVKDILFPYVVENAHAYLVETWDSTETKEDVRAIRAQMIIDDKISIGPSDERKVERPTDDTEDLQRVREIKEISECVTAMVKADRKIGCLKQLQGHMWRKGYENNTIKGHVYKDVLTALDTWKRNGVKLCIYSSGSVEAQKLLFRYSENGDMNQLFMGNFDTKVGKKTEKSSYDNISEKLGTDSKNILFITDIGAEVDAAQSAGYQVILSDRPGVVRGKMDSQNITVIQSFNEIDVVPAKKKTIL